MKITIMRLVALLPLLVACGQEPQATSDEYLSSAFSYYNQGEFKAAQIELKNSLVKDPRNASARFLLGQLYVRTGHGLGAEKELLLAREYGIEDSAVLPYLATALLKSRQFDKVLSINVSEHLSLLSRSEILAQQGIALISLGRLEEVDAKLDESLTLNPDGDLAASAAATLALVRGDRARARTLLGDVLERNDRFARALSTLGDLESVEGHPQEAVIAYEKAISERFDNIEDRWKLSVVYIGLGEIDGAREQVKRLRSIAPNYPGRYLSEGLIALSDGEADKALDLFEETIRRDSTDRFPSALAYAAISALKTDRLESADSYINRYRLVRPNELLGVRISAYILARRGRYNAVVELLQPIADSGQGEVFVKNLLASALINTGKGAEGVRLLESLATTDQVTAQAVTRIGLSLIRIGETDVGLDKLETAVNLDPEFDQASLILAFGYIKAGQLDRALAEANRYQEASPESYVAYLILGFVQTQIGNMDEAKSAFAKADELEPGNPAANHQLALFAANTGDLIDAKRRYQRILEFHPDDLGALIGLAKVAKQDGGGPAVEANLKRAISAHPNALEPRVLLAQHLIDEGRATQAVESLADKRQIGSRNPVFLRALGMAETAAGAHEQANTTYRQLVSVQPNSAHAHYLLARSFGELGDINGVRRHLQTALDLQPELGSAQLAYAKLAASMGDWRQVEKFLSQSDPALLEYEDVALLAAEAAIARNDIDMAKKLLRKQLNRNPSDSVVLGMIKVHLRANDPNGALTLAKGWINEHPASLPVRQAAAEIAEVLGQDTVAIDQYEAILKLDPEHVVALNNLSELIRDQAPRQAYQYAVKAQQYAPGNPAVLDTLAASALAAGNLREAERAIDRALKISPHNPALIYRKGTILKAIGQTEEGQALVDRATAK